MSKSGTFMEREFASEDYDPDDADDFRSVLVLVIMPFRDSDASHRFEAINEAGYINGVTRCSGRRAPGSPFVLREITQFIEEGEFIVCDLTNERSNVYYELGYANGVGNEAGKILLLAHEGTMIHFHIAPLRVRHYSSHRDLNVLVQQELKALMNAARRRQSRLPSCPRACLTTQ